MSECGGGGGADINVGALGDSVKDEHRYTWYSLLR